MFTVYLDSQLYRYLKNDSEVDLRIKSLKAFLEENSNNFLVFYSHAHLLDLKEDKSDKKYDDLIYMQKWVDKNFLILYYKQDQATYELTAPIQK